MAPSRIDRREALARLGLTLIAPPAWAAAPGGGPASPGLAAPPPTRAPAPALGFRVSEFSVVPAQPFAGQAVQLTMVVEASGSGSAALRWELRHGSAVLAQGTQTLAAGQRFQRSVSWTATPGSHAFSAVVDPHGEQPEAPAARADNLVQRVLQTMPADWPAWIDAAWVGTRQAVQGWAAAASLSGVSVNGMVAAGGQLAGPNLKPTIKAAMQAAQVPDAVAEPLASAIAAAWRTWHEGLTVPGLPWFPPFETFPGAFAPTMVAAPVPLVMLASSQAAVLTPPLLRARLVAALGPLANAAGASAAIDDYVLRLSGRMATWLPAVMIANARGSGPVPGYDPPRAPVGRVVNGSVENTPGVLSTPAF